MLLKVVIIEGDYDWADQFSSNAFSSDKLTVVGIEQDMRSAAEMIEEQKPSLLLIDQSAHNGSGLKVLERFAREYDHIPIIFTTSSRRDIILHRNAMSKGAIDVLYKPYTINQVLTAAFQYLEQSQALQIDEEQQEEVQERGRTASLRRLASEGAKNEQRSGQRMVKTNQGGAVVRQEIITVYSPKGGVGKTTVSCNIAAAIAANKVLPLKVCLVDLDVSFGNTATVLNLDEPPYSVLDFDQYEAEEYDRRLVEQLVVKHPSGIDFIASPRRAEDSAKINRVDENGVRKGKELVEKVLSVLRNYYDVIVIDVGPSLREDSTITAIDNSTKVLVVATSDIPTLRNVMSCQETFDGLIGLDQSKMRVLLNRTQKGNSGVNPNTLNEIIPYMVIGKLPEDPLVQRLANEGKLSVIDAPHSPFSESVFSIVHKIVPVYGNTKKAGFFARLFGKRRTAVI